MKTQNFQFDLMKGNQTNKDIIYNENILKLDHLIKNTVIDFISDVPKDPKVGEKFIISSGTHKNCLCFKPHEGKSVSIVTPTIGMIFYIHSKGLFYIFEQEGWQQINFANNHNKEQSNVAISSNSLLTGEEKFLGIEGKYEAPTDREFLHLYVNDNVEINLDQVKTRLITFIIKNHYQTAKNLIWPHNILWQGKKSHELTKKANSTDIVRIYRLIETNHFLGEIIGQDYQF